MSDLTNMIKKEIRELLTLQTIIPMLVMALIFVGMGGVTGGINEEATKNPLIGIINEDDGSLSGIATAVLNGRAEVVYNSTDRADVPAALEQVKEKDGVAVLVIPEGFSDSIYGNSTGKIQIYWIMKGAGIMDSVSTGVVDALIQAINHEIAKELIEQDISVNPEIALNPTIKNETTIFKGKEMEGLSPVAITGMLSSQSTIVPVVMMMIIITAGSIVISSMGMEKENKTLETLLTLPIKRSSIIAGKIVASAVVGLLMAVIYMLGFGYYMHSLTTGLEVNLADFGLALGIQDYVLVGLSVFVTLLAGLSLCMLLGAFAKDYKSAQTFILPITALTMIPMLIIMFKDFNTLPVVLQGLLFAIPFSHPMMAMRALLFDDYLLVLGGILYVTLFAAVTVAVVVHIFKTDRLLIGRISKKK
ncbi:MAG: ABC transporter permease [Candidatus Methanosuratus sp.]|nr:ABC transporter permease [Candidatus Methanosuratincola sp.]